MTAVDRVAEVIRADRIRWAAEDDAPTARGVTQHDRDLAAAVLAALDAQPGDTPAWESVEPMLMERSGDPEFRRRLAERIERDGKILRRLAEHDGPSAQPGDTGQAGLTGRQILAAALYRLEWDADLYATPRSGYTERVYERRADRLTALLAARATGQDG